MPGIDLFSAERSVEATVETVVELPAPEKAQEVNGTTPREGVYYNARLDPKNFLEGTLSWNPATRLRQMLARPGIVVCDTIAP